MKELNIAEVESVNGGGWLKLIAEAIVSGAAWDFTKAGVTYLLENSHMGKGNFPPVPRAGRE